MTHTKNILAVIDPTAEEQPALERAAWVARSLGAGLELFACVYDQYLSGQRFFDSQGLQKARQDMLNKQLARLDRLKTRVASAGVEVSVDARWDHPLDEGIVRKATEAQPLLVAKDTHYHAALKRTLFSNTDWNLIRSCPTPLLLVKQRAIGDVPTILASVDPTHERDEPAELDNVIMSVAKELATAAAGKLHVFHAFDPAPAIASVADTMATPIAVPIRELTSGLEQRHRQALDALLEEYPVEKDRVHFHQGLAQDLLVKLAEQLEADFIVMGAVSRSGLKRIFIGSTAERVLDRLPCDLIIVKAPGFDAPG
jgi:universal stress protein E